MLSRSSSSWGFSYLSWVETVSINAGCPQRMDAPNEQPDGLWAVEEEVVVSLSELPPGVGIARATWNPKWPKWTIPLPQLRRCTVPRRCTRECRAPMGIRDRLLCMVMVGVGDRRSSLQLAYNKSRSSWNRMAIAVDKLE